jgi:diketogulonate reductase-like aldo/keto reductase
VTNAGHSTLDLQGPIGLGTWRMGSSSRQRKDEASAVTHALQLGYRLIDTAEMYADGGAEQVVGAALDDFGRQRRAGITIVSKVMPGNASAAGTVRACEASLKRLGCEYLDLYLLHWPGRHPYIETLRGFEQLLQRGLIRHFGVSNLDLHELQQWIADEKRAGLSAMGTQCNQLYYALSARGIEFDQLPWQRRHQIQTMAYSPLGEGRLVEHPMLTKLAAARGVSAAQIALAWCIRQPGVVAIPKSARRERMEENLRAAQITLTPDELSQLDRAFPPPRSRQPLEMI